MTPYSIYFSGVAEAELEALRLRAVQAGRFDEFEKHRTKILSVLADPRRALNVGHLIFQTAPPLTGGFYCEWRRGCFFLKYAVFPDHGSVSIFHIEFSPLTWV